ncbi:uncharacterized protein LOC106459935 isoform X2 [Limulus polyphemus]|uniref:Uncharacterized protein LOC106459935 isoform X2 n=1 Tax=Limulus polyphemus TaxID=6850 RepID=A0ABM1SL81_LIMPO|nr:uncharacterized protein LOC106459935 isoform X2 [Limulus polyphemus]
MGGCFSKLTCRCCPNKKKNRHYSKTKYFGLRSIIEFENLIREEDTKEPNSISSWLNFRKKKLMQKEESLEMEITMTIEGRKEAARMESLTQSSDIMNPAKLVFHSEHFGWLGDDPQNWITAGDEECDTTSNHSKVDDSLVTLLSRQRSLNSSVNHLLTRDRLTTFNSTPPSSIDLEWDDEAGLTPPPPPSLLAPDDDGISAFVSDTTSRSIRSTPPSNGNELEWDGEFNR